MTLFILLFFLIVAAFLFIFKWHRSSYFFCSIALLFFIAIGSGWLPSVLLKDLQSNYVPASANTNRWGSQNAIVVLGAGTTRVAGSDQIDPGFFSYGRIAKAFSMYKSCQQASPHCSIIISGADAQQHGVSEAALYSAYLAGMGVNSADLILEDKSMNTWQNAQFTSRLLNEKAFDEVKLVSSGIHLRRSLLYFNHFGVSPQPVRADYLSAKMSVLPSAFNFTGADFAIHEYIGILRYHVYNALGLNPPVATATAFKTAFAD